MSDKVETVNVVADVPGGYMRINEEDYDPKVHKLYGEDAGAGAGAGAGSDSGNVDALMVADLLKKSVGDIAAELPECTDEELLALHEGETAGKARKGVLEAIEVEIAGRK